MKDKIAVGMVTLYLVWGSTYLAVRYALEGFPPCLLSGLRFLAAGSLIYAWARPRRSAPSAQQWLRSGTVGVLLLVLGAGGIAWAEQEVPSGQAALLVCIMPVWMVLLQWAGGAAPSPAVLLGLASGLSGVGLLAGTARGGYSQLVILLASLAWAGGSLLSRRWRQDVLGSAMGMLVAGVVLCSLALLRGDVLAAPPTSAWLAELYLVLFGSILGFSTYVYLLRVAQPALVATYTYVNPLVAVALGSWLAGERLGWQSLQAGVLVVLGVLLISLGDRLQLRLPRFALAAR